jgi:S1-C subfamily serine protease
VAAATAPPATGALGLALRARARMGTEIVRVERGSAGARAGLTAGDLITLIGDVNAPTPRQVTRSFASLPHGERLLLGVSRGKAHFVTTLER